MLANILVALHTVKCENWIFFNEKKTIKNAKITKKSHANEGYASTYDIEILNSFNPELPFKDTGFVIRNKRNDLFTELKEFKFVMTLVLQSKKRESDDETKYSSFYSTSKAETIVNESEIDDVYESIIVRLYQTFFKISWKRFGLYYWFSRRSPC